MTDFTQKNRTDNMKPFQLTLEFNRYVTHQTEVNLILNAINDLIYDYPTGDPEGRELLVRASDTIAQSARHLNLTVHALDKAIRLRMGETQESVDIPF